MKCLRKVYVGEIRGIDEKEMTLTAFVSTNARDRMDEVLMPEGVDMTNFKKNPVVLWAHDYGAPPIGKAQWIKREGDGIISKVKFAPTPFAQEIFQLYKEGFLKAFSVGFIPKKYEDGDGEKKPRRTYTAWELLEYSAVPVPANPEALTLAIEKGVLKNETIKTAIEKGLDADDDKFDEDEPGESHEEAPKDVTTKPKDNPETKKEEQQKDTGLEDLQAENQLLTEKVSGLEKENAELRYKLYELTNTKTQEPTSGITDDELADKVAKVVVGVVRKAQGKVD